MVAIAGLYLDTASAEPLHPAASAVLDAAYARGYADPRRLHGPGRDARLILDNAREAVAGALGFHRDEVTFTGSGTEAVHRGLLGLARPRRALSRTILHSAVDHQSVFHAAAWWGDSSVMAVDDLGRLSPTRLARRTEGCAVVALATANQEIGTLQPVTELAEAAGDLPVFVDACASMGRLRLPVGAAVYAGSARKWGGPAGVGVLIVTKRAQWESALPGDDRIDPHGVGFENIPGALAAAAALQATVSESADLGSRQWGLRQVLRSRLAQLDGVTVLGDDTESLPHLVTVAIAGIDGEPVASELARRDIAVGSGSACASSTLDRERSAPELVALDAASRGNLRISLGRETTETEVDEFVRSLGSVLADFAQS